MTPEQSRLVAALIEAAQRVLANPSYVVDVNAQRALQEAVDAWRDAAGEPQ